MSLHKVIYEVDYLVYGGRLAGVRAAISWAVVGNRFASGGGVCGQWGGRVWVADGSWSRPYQLSTTNQLFRLRLVAGCGTIHGCLVRD